MSISEKYFLKFKDISLHGFLSSINAITAISSLIILAILYSPLHFSFYGIFLSASSVFSTFCKSNLDKLMLTVKSNKDENLCINMFILNFFMICSLIFFVSIVIYFFNIDFYFLNQWSTLLTFVLLLYIFSNSFLILMNSYFIKNENLVIYNLTTFLTQIIFLTLAFINQKLNFYFFNYIDLVIFFTVSKLLVVLIFYKFFIKKINFKFNLVSEYFTKVKKLKNFYFFGNCTDLFLSIKDVVFLNSIQSVFGLNILGQFIFFQKTFMSILSLFDKVIGDIYVRNINSLIIKKKNINKEYFFFLTLASFVSLTTYILITLFSETIFNIFFEKKWSISIEILSIYSILICFSFVPSLLNRFLCYYYQEFDFFWSIIFLLLIIISINFFYFSNYIDFFKFFAKLQLFIYLLYLLLSFFVIYKLNSKKINSYI
jgi:O-antigen/teichoic acid export membrane protein